MEDGNNNNPAPDHAGAFRQILTTVAPNITMQRAQVLERLYAAEKPGDVQGWLKTTLSQLEDSGTPSRQNQPHVQQQPPQAPMAPSNAGAPVREMEASSLPENPFQWPLDVAKKLGIEVFRDRLKEFQRRHGGSPYAEWHETRRASQRGADSIEVLARKLAGHLKTGR